MPIDIYLLAPNENVYSSTPKLCIKEELHHALFQMSGIDWERYPCTYRMVDEYNAVRFKGEDLPSLDEELTAILVGDIDKEVKFKYDHLHQLVKDAISEKKVLVVMGD